MNSLENIAIKTDLSPDKEKNEFIREKLYQFNTDFHRPITATIATAKT